MSETRDSAASPNDNPPPDDTVGRAVETARQKHQAGRPVRETLTGLATTAEIFAGPGSAASILVLDQDGLLRNGASPNLPADYLDAIDRLKPNPHLGTCAAAAATGNVVITPDFTADNKWAELRHLPLALGYRGAWSMPIKTPEGTVLGTFGTYYRETRTPTSVEVQGIKRLAEAAAHVLATR